MCSYSCVLSSTREWLVCFVQAFGAWLLAHEDAQAEKADALHASHLAARSMAAWQLAMALMHRKRVLTAAAKQLRMTWCLRKGLRGWMVFTYYKHMGHVALHFRVRRLGCVVLQEWQQVGGWSQACRQLMAWQQTRTGCRFVGVQDILCFPVSGFYGCLVSHALVAGPLCKAGAQVLRLKRLQYGV